jgi:hypothetical protein
MKQRKKRKQYPIRVPELVHPTFRETKPPGTFKPLTTPINESTLWETEKTVRTDIGKFLTEHGLRFPNRGQIDQIIFKAIDFAWGAADLPSDEYAYIHFSVLKKIYARPQRRLFTNIKEENLLKIGSPEKGSGRLVLPPSNFNRRPSSVAPPQEKPTVQTSLFGEDSW